MRKAILFILATIIIMTLTACGSSDPPQNNSDPSATPTSTAPSSTPDSTEIPESESKTQEALPPENTENSGTSILVAYFSMPETTDPNNMTKDEDNSVVVIDGEVLGNTQYGAAVLLCIYTAGEHDCLTPPFRRI